MPRSTVMDPVVTRTTTDKVFVPTPVRSTSQTIDPKCRLVTGDQTVTPEPAQ